MPSIDEKNRRLGEMLGIARRRVMKEDYIPRKRVEWRVVYCPRCNQKIEYYPKDKHNFKGTLLCTNPECRIRFKVPSLDSFLKSDGEEGKGGEEK